MSQDLIDAWLDWNEFRIKSHDFCIAFERLFRKEIRERIRRKQNLKHRILRELIVDE